MTSVLLSVLFQLVQLALVLAVAPLLTGCVRFAKARLLGRSGADPLQPYRTLLRLFRKEAVVAHGTSWLFRAAPYAVFTLIWLAAGLVPTFSTQLVLAPAADLIALVALLGSARFFTILAGMDAGTAFGGIGASREAMIATLAEPAMLMVIFTLAILLQTTSLAGIVETILGQGVGLRISLALGLVSLLMVAIAEAGRIPIDNPSTHLELTMVHEAMVLEYSGRHLALMELAGMLRLLLFMALIACVFCPWGIARAGDGPLVWLLGLVTFFGKMMVAVAALAVFETSIAKMRVFRIGEFLGGALLLGLLASIFLFVSTGFKG
ncbi:respiratory chain complex I subunit 1 family protein [Oleisolibacter albus]|uniref:respiratory chain complex I subunit 1 family protein n=1 Tax=Oleisolibacter albus TaxID=2171757 RepID=UPI001874986D|nr:NADH-quinone oxidoreductase subunit H [Oleisolibacter albus]